MYDLSKSRQKKIKKIKRKENPYSREVKKEYLNGLAIDFQVSFNEILLEAAGTLCKTKTKKRKA